MPAANAFIQSRSSPDGRRGETSRLPRSAMSLGAPYAHSTVKSIPVCLDRNRADSSSIDFDVRAIRDLRDVVRFYTAAFKTSRACFTAINAASLPPRSGCVFIAAFANAFLTCSFEAGHVIPSVRAAELKRSSLVGSGFFGVLGRGCSLGCALGGS